MVIVCSVVFYIIPVNTDYNLLVRGLQCAVPENPKKSQVSFLSWDGTIWCPQRIPSTTLAEPRYRVLIVPLATNAIPRAEPDKCRLTFLGTLPPAWAHFSSNDSLRSQHNLDPIQAIIRVEKTPFSPDCLEKLFSDDSDALIQTVSLTESTDIVRTLNPNHFLPINRPNTRSTRGFLPGRTHPITASPGTSR